MKTMSRHKQIRVLTARVNPPIVTPPKLIHLKLRADGRRYRTHSAAIRSVRPTRFNSRRPSSPPNVDPHHSKSSHSTIASPQPRGKRVSR